ncbi:MAG: GNAT family N-acetyltransferase [Flavobacteriales bacterium]
MSEISFEICKSEHYKAVADIYNEHILLGVSNMVDTTVDASVIGSWISKFNSRERLYACLKNGKVVGWGIIKRYSDREGYKFACETAIYLKSSETGKGYGSKMKNFLIEECKQMNYRHLVAKIFATNTASIAYNEKIGYSIVGRQNEIGFRNGKWLDMIIMQYIIK